MLSKYCVFFITTTELDKECYSEIDVISKFIVEFL